MKPEKKIERLLNKMNRLGPMLPGSLSEQWSVCGNDGCACRNTKNPKKHGPYYQLSFSVKGKSSTMFIKEKDVDEARVRLERYKQYKELSFELIRTNIELARTNGLERSASNVRS